MASAVPSRPIWPPVMAAVIVVSYNTWVFAFVNPHPAPLSGYLSELAAAGQPHAWFFRLGDVVAGILMIVTALLGSRRWRARFGGFAIWMALAVAAAGVGTIADTVAHMPCAPTLDAACRTLYPAAPSGPGFTLHTATSAVVFIGVLSSLALAGLARRSGRCFAVGGLVLALSAGSLLIEVTLGSGQGYVQAIQVLLVSVWVARLALLLGTASSPRLEGRAPADGEGRRR